MLLVALHLVAYSQTDHRVFALADTQVRAAGQARPRSRRRDLFFGGGGAGRGGLLQAITKNPGLTLFAVVLGYYTFGFQGLVIGPLALYLLLVIYHLVQMGALRKGCEAGAKVMPVARGLQRLQVSYSEDTSSGKPNNTNGTKPAAEDGDASAAVAPAVAAAAAPPADVPGQGWEVGLAKF